MRKFLSVAGTLAIIAAIAFVCVGCSGSTSTSNDTSDANADFFYSEKSDVERMVKADAVKQFLAPELPLYPDAKMQPVTCIESKADGVDYRCHISIVNHGENFLTLQAYVECDAKNCLWEYW